LRQGRGGKRSETKKKEGDRREGRREEEGGKKGGEKGDRKVREEDCPHLSHPSCAPGGT